MQAKKVLIALAEIKGKHNKVTHIKGGAEHKRLTLVVRAKVSSDDESYFIDNLTLTRR